ncbi:MAG: hypothetical protein ACK5RK_01485 [Betaproteobacteria bacterium]
MEVDAVPYEPGKFDRYGVGQRKTLGPIDSSDGVTVEISAIAVEGEV